MLDGVNASPVVREWITHNLRQFGIEEIACFWMDTPLEVCIERFRKRGPHLTEGTRILDEGIIRRHAGEFIPPSVEEGFDRVVAISL